MAIRRHKPWRIIRERITRLLAKGIGREVIADRMCITLAAVAQAEREFWTLAKVAELRNLWAEGATGSQIAAKLKTTRCAVLAKARRLKLAARVADTSAYEARALRGLDRPRAAA